MSDSKMLSAKQRAFVHQYVRLGGKNATAAAVAAGYGKGPHVSAHRLLRYPYILDAIREETERKLRASVSLGADILEDLAKNAQSESVRLQAAQALLDRGGMQIARLAEHRHVIEDRRTDAELIAHVGNLARELGLSGRVIDGQLVPPAALADMQASTLKPEPSATDFEDLDAEDLDADTSADAEN